MYSVNERQLYKFLFLINGLIKQKFECFFFFFIYQMYNNGLLPYNNVVFHLFQLQMIKIHYHCNIQKIK
jgi:hypothetical protein